MTVERLQVSEVEISIHSVHAILREHTGINFITKFILMASTSNNDENAKVLVTSNTHNYIFALYP